PAAALRGKPTPPAPLAKRPAGRKPAPPPAPRDSGYANGNRNGDRDEGSGTDRSGAGTPQSQSGGGGGGGGGLAGGLAEALRKRQAAMTQKEEPDGEW
ncbi:hypothetical protein LTR28_004271, partial [Elasticomyces elasticus]